MKKFYEAQNPEGQAASSNNDPPLVEQLLNSSPVIDDGFIQSLWDQLKEQPDVEVKSTVNVDAPTNGSSLHLDRAGKRLFAGEDRIWNAVAGHGPDRSRLPQMEFDILLVVAALAIFHGMSTFCYLSSTMTK